MSRKDEILKAATDLFYTKGYQSTTMKDIAGRVGINKASLYHYYKNKMELLVEIYTDNINVFAKQIADIAHSNMSPIDKLRQVIKTHVRATIVERKAMMSVFLDEERQLPEKFYQTIRMHKKNYNKLIEDIYIDGKNNGFFQDVDPVLQVNAIMGMCTWAYRWYRENGIYSPEKIMDYFIKILEEGYLTPKHKGTVQKIDTLEVEGTESTDSDISVTNILEEIQYHSSRIDDLTQQLNNILSK